MPPPQQTTTKKPKKIVEAEVKQDFICLLIGTADTLRSSADMITKLAATLSSAE